MKGNPRKSDDCREAVHENRYRLTGGGDFHNDTYRPTCGVEFPDGITDHHGLRDFLLSDTPKALWIHEPNTKAPYLLTYNTKHPKG